MPDYTLQDIDELANNGLLSKKERALLRQDFYQQSTAEEGALRKLIGHLSHEVTAGWENVKVGAITGTKTDKKLSEAATSHIQVIAGALQILSALPTSLGRTTGEKVQDFLLRRGANQTVAALAATVADITGAMVGGAVIGKTIKTSLKQTSAGTAPAAAPTPPVTSEQVRKGIEQWLDEALTPAAPATKANLTDIVKPPSGQDIPLAGKAGKMLGERKALPPPNVEKAAQILDDAGDRPVAETIASVHQAVTASNPTATVANALNGNGKAQQAIKELDDMVPKAKTFRLTAGDTAEMKAQIGKETDPFTLFNVALDQTTPRDIRQLAANRINDINKKSVSEYLRGETDLETLKKISRSGLFTSQHKSFAKSKVETLTMVRGGDDVTRAEDIGAFARARGKFEEGLQRYEESRINIRELHAEAQQSEMNIADLLNLRPGEAKTPLEVAEISKPLREFGESFIRNVDEAETRLANGDYGKFWEALSDFHLMVESHWPYMFPRQVAGQTLKVYDEPVLSGTRFLQQIPKFSSWLAKLKLNTADEVEAAAPIILREMQKLKAPSELSRFAKSVAEEMAEHGDEVLNDPSFRDKARFYFVNSLMSGTDTIGRNITGNIAGALWHYPEKLTTAISAKAMNPFLNSKHHLEGGFAGEANAFITTWARSMWDATRYALRRQWNDVYGLVPDEQALAGLIDNRYDLKRFANTGTTNPFSGTVGRIIGTPVSIAQAADEISRIALYRAAAGETLYRNWIQSGSKMPWGQYLDEGLANLPPSAHEYAMRVAGEFTFSDRMTAFGRGIAGMRENIPGMEYIVPFIRTADRLTAFQYNRTPGLSLLSKRLLDEFNSGDPTVRAEALGRIVWANTIGAGLFIAAKTAAPDGMTLITGGGPTDRQLANQLKNANVHVPYSIWTPAGRVGFAGLAPIRGPLGIIADTAEIWDELRNPTEASSLWEGIALGLSRNFFDMTYTKQLSDMIEIWDNPSGSSSAFSRLTANMVKGFAEPAIVRQMFREIDPTVKESRDIWDELTREIPGWGGPPRRNPLTGEPVLVPPRLLDNVPGLGWFLPTSPIQPANDAYAKKIRELKMKVPEFPSSFAGNTPSESPFAYSGALGEAREAMAGIPIPPELKEKGKLYAFGAENFGETLNDEMQRMVSDPDFNRLAPIDQADAIKGVYQSRYTGALERLKEEHPELLEAYEQKVMQREAVRMPPEERDGFEQTLEASPEFTEPVSLLNEDATP